VDIALFTYFILRQTEDHYIYDSQLTLANRLGCERQAVSVDTASLSTLTTSLRQSQRDSRWRGSPLSLTKEPLNALLNMPQCLPLT
jgi:hypothetical protein